MFFSKRRKAIAAEVRAKLGESGIVAIDESANCFGVESGGVTQIRGNGCLAATSDDVLFIMWIPHKEIRIPRAQVTGVERTRSHLGKTKGTDLLRLRFVNDQGHPDSIAWWVRDLSAWEAALGS